MLNEEIAKKQPIHDKMTKFRASIIQQCQSLCDLCRLNPDAKLSEIFDGLIMQRNIVERLPT